MNERRETTPHDPLTELGNEMLGAFEKAAEAKGLTDARAIALVRRGDDGGIAFSGYESDRDVVNDMIGQLRAILRTSGMELHVVQVPKHDEETSS